MAWTVAARRNEITEGKPKITVVNGKEIGVFHEGGAYYAVLNYCPHFGAPVCLGKVMGRIIASGPDSLDYDNDHKTLRCPWHHWEFDLATGAALAPIRQRLKTYPVAVEGDNILVDI